MPVIARKVILFVGFGSIAKHTAKIAKVFDMKVHAIRRSGVIEENERQILDRVYSLNDKEECFRNADFIVSTLPDTPETRDYFGVKEFQWMKQSCVFEEEQWLMKTHWLMFWKRNAFVEQYWMCIRMNRWIKNPSCGNVRMY